MRNLHKLALGSAILVYALIVLGALVRTTNSGLSCPDWPTCYGYWIPLPSHLEAIPNVGYTYGQVMLEWVHRLIAGVFLGPLMLVLGVLAFLRRREQPAVAVTGVALVVLLLVQGALGGITVLDSNSPWSVALHLGNALLILTLALRMWVLTSGWQPAPASAPIGAHAAIAWGFALIAMVSAAMTAKSGSSLACTTWPLCDGQVIPDLTDGGVRIHFIHRVMAAATGMTLLLLLWRARANAAVPEPVRRLVTAAAALVVIQIGLGALVILLEVPVWKAVLHQAVGVLTFAIVTLVMWRCLPQRGAARPAAGGRHGLALRGA